MKSRFFPFGLLIAAVLVLHAQTPASWEISTDASRNPRLVAMTLYPHIELAAYPATQTTFSLPPRFATGAISYCHFLPATIPAAKMAKPTVTLIQPSPSTGAKVVITRPAFSALEVAAASQPNPPIYALQGGCQVN